MVGAVMARVDRSYYVGAAGVKEYMAQGLGWAEKADLQNYWELGMWLYYLQGQGRGEHVGEFLA